MKLANRRKLIKFSNTALASLLVLGSILPTSLLPKVYAEETAADHLVISEIFGGGGNSNASYKNDYIEIYNPTDQEVVLDGWSVQYTTKVATFATNNYITPLTGKISPKGHYLIKQFAGSSSAPLLPVKEDVTGNFNINHYEGKVALVMNKTTAISGKEDPAVIDFVGYGGADQYENSAFLTTGINNLQTIQRLNENIDTNNNSVDFKIDSPNPKSSTNTPVEQPSTTPKAATIGQVRDVDTNGSPKLLDSYVIVEGTVTAGTDVLGNRTMYIQDPTGGVNIYKTGTTGILQPGVTNYTTGMKVKVTGKVIFFNGLTEIEPTSIEIIQPNSEEVQAQVKSILDITSFSTAEVLEGSLVKVIAKATSVSSSSTSMTFVDPNDSTKVFAVKDKTYPSTNISSQVVQGTIYEITGVLGQTDSSSPYNTGYELYPRSINDFKLPLAISHAPLESVYKDVDIQFNVDVQNANSVVVYYKGVDDTQYTALPMAATEGTQYTATLVKENVPPDSFVYYIEVKNDTETKQAGSESNPYTVTLIDDKVGPSFSNETPSLGTKVEDYRPTISVDLKDDSGINTTNYTVTIDQKDIKAQSTLVDGKLSISLANDLRLGLHTVVVTAEDTKGNKNTITWSFEVIEVFTGGHHFRGTTHNHTNISHDGAGTPEEALLAAKKYNYDWFAFSDHSHDIDADQVATDNVTNANGKQERTGGSDWQLTKNLADQYTVNNEFVVFPAFEMTSTTWGHSNVFGTENFIDRKQSGGTYQNLDQYYSWILSYDDVVAQFNHPDMSANAFNSFKPYKQDVDKLFTMLEVGNGSGHYGYANAEQKYFSALDLGWHLAPTYGEDNHEGTWGETNKRTVIVADSLSNDSLLHAMRNMRVYMTEDPNFTLDMLANGKYMGSTVDGTSISFNISGSDAVVEVPGTTGYDYLKTDYVSKDNVTKVELVSNGGKVIQSYSPGTKSFSWKPVVDNVSSSQWYIVRVTQEDGERVYSAPIWSAEVDQDIKITDVRVEGGVVVGGNPATVQADLSNLGKLTIENVKVEFYYDEVSADNKIGETLPKNVASKTAETFSVVWNKPLSGKHKLIAKIIGAPSGDVQEDNLYEIELSIKEPLGKKILIDAAHKNENTTTDTSTYKDNLKAFTKMLQVEGYEVVESVTPFTTELLSDVDVVVMTQPYFSSSTVNNDLTAAENTALSEFVKNGGSLLLAGKSNYRNDPTISNDLLQQIGATIQINHDGIYDDSKEGNFWSDPAKSKHAVKLHPSIVKNYLTDRVSTVNFYSGTSLTKIGNEPLTDSDSVIVLAYGNETTYQNYVNTALYKYDTVSDTQGGSVIPAIAAETVGKGKIVVSGMNIFNDKQLDESFEKNGNNELTMNTINWLAGRGTKVDTISTARNKNFEESVVIEGIVTSDTNTFFDAFYVQDETGGIFAFNEIPNKDALKLGDKVRIYGKIKVFEGDREIEFASFNQDVIKIGQTTPVDPTDITTGEASIEEKQGLLVKVTGKVVRNYDANSYVINDGSGDILIFVDGYIKEKTGPVPDLKVGEYMEAVGFLSTFTDGKRIRVRDTKELKQVATPNPGTGGETPGTTPNPGTGGQTPGTTPNPGTGGQTPGTTPGPDVPKNKVVFNDVKIVGSKATVVLDSSSLPAIPTGGVLEIEASNSKSSLTLNVQVPLEVLKAVSAKNASIEVDKGEVSYTVPSSIIKMLINEANGKEITFNMTKLKDNLVDNSFAAIYDFTIMAGNKKISNFNGERIQLSFKVDLSKLGNINLSKIKVYYINDENELVEELSDSKLDAETGIITASTNHFSKYGVFVEGQSSQGAKLPKTATNHFNIMFIGLLLLVIGFSGVIFQRRFRNR